MSMSRFRAAGARRSIPRGMSRDFFIAIWRRACLIAHGLDPRARGAYRHVMTPAEYEAAGLYDPSHPKAAERLELLEWCAAQGYSLQDMQFAKSRGLLLFIASVAVGRIGPFLSQAQLAERLGVDPSVLEAFRVAFALPPVAPEAPWCNEKEALMFESVAGGVELFGETGMLRLSRVLGSSVSRVAEAMASSNSERLRRMAEDGATELEIAKANLAAIETADAPAKIMTGLLGIHLQLAATRLRERRVEISADVVHLCVGFVDLVGSTTMSRGLSARDLADTVDRFEEISHRVAVNRRGRVVKFIGDEVMFVTSGADSACDIALALIEAFADDRTLTPRGGLAYGPMIDRCGDYYGPVVNLAARLGELAVPREVLVTSELAARIESPALRCEPAGRRTLRGFDEPVAILSVARS
jgi:adenylate cyclase